ncbi:alpha-L-rhamnosidase C-terminal domain-containing protein [Pseudonocardia nematodicida]|uniref:Alpha-L-rhamnosidase C-terminal domain-containing protein n=1 Tax=Pseudonocardia nematodicida TaxID=1206997 RepID=A0ABV1KEC1_9PSEU
MTSGARRAPGTPARDAVRASRDPVPERPGPSADVPAELVAPVAVEVLGAAGGAHDVCLLCTAPDRTAEPPVRIATTEAHSTVLVADLGRLLMGVVEIGVTAPPGAVVRVAYAQFRQRLTVQGDGMGRPFGTDALPWSRVDLFEVTEPGLLRSPGKREVRYVAITLDGPGELALSHVRLRPTTYPVRDDGSFRCDDELLTRAWYAGAHTGDLATVSEAGSPWMLTVTFDRVLFMGDLHLQALAGYPRSSDYAWLVRNSLRQYVRVQNPDGSFPAATSHLVPWTDPDTGAAPTGWPADAPDPDHALGRLGPLSLHRDLRIDSFTAFWVAAVADHLLHTGDTGFARAMLPVARRAVAFLRGRAGPDGLYAEPADRRTDPSAEHAWVSNWAPTDVAAGVDAFGNAVYHAALHGLALLEEEAGGSAVAAAELRSQADTVRTALLAHLFDERAGAFVLNDRDPLRDHTADANAANLVFGTLDPARADAVLRFLSSRLATPFGTSSSEYSANPYRMAGIVGYPNALEALGRMRHGDGHGAVDLIRRWWGHMLENGPGTGWFHCEDDGSLPARAFANSSWTTPVPALSEGVLGVRPRAPGYRRFVVAPRTSGLRWAQGHVPAPGGGLTVRWEHRRDDAGETFRLTVVVPGGAHGHVVVPLQGADRTIAVDGEVVWDHGGPVAGGPAARPVDGGVELPAGPGTHTWAW